MNKPSSTITAAFLSGIATTLVWQLAQQFYFGPQGISVDPALVSTCTTFVGSLVGYFWPETVYPEGWKAGPG